MNPELSEFRPIEELRSSGLLWLINRVVFHPRGLALGVNVEDDGSISGWCLMGEGSEPWTFTAADDDESFTLAEATLAQAIAANRAKTQP